jgi:hypothetical protein
MNLSLDNLQSTALSRGRLDAVLCRYVDRLSRHAWDAHLQLTANRIFVARDNGRLSEVSCNVLLAAGHVHDQCTGRVRG